MDAAAIPEHRASRADIVDRNGVVLATNLRVPGVYADPSRLADKAAAARRLAAILPGVDAADCSGDSSRGKHFAWVKHRITPEEQEAVLELGLPGVGFSLAEHRVYPKGQLTSHVTWASSMSTGVGLAGIERSLDGPPEPGRRAGGAEPRSAHPADRARGAGRRVTAASSSIGANAMVLDRITGELLAMVSLPDFDPNRVGNVEGHRVSQPQYSARSTSWARCSRS